jgi:cation transport regulator ChaB
MRKTTDQPVPYPKPESLPATVRADLPAEARQAYLDAFNKAWLHHADFADREAFCHRLARTAVRRLAPRRLRPAQAQGQNRASS